MSDRNEPETYWWDTTSLAAARGSFRTSLQDRHKALEDIWSAWMGYFIVANVHGRTRFASQCLTKLIKQADEQKLQLEKALSKSSLGGFTRICFRGLLALADQADTPLDEVHRVAAQVGAFFDEDGCSVADRAVLRLSLAPRLGLPREPGDVMILQEAWQAFQRWLAIEKAKPKVEDKDDDEGANETGFNAVCTAAAGQTLVDCLLEQDRQLEALMVLEEALERDPCIGPCGLAPQGMLAASLEPLRLSGQVTRAERNCERLALVAPVSAAWLMPTGARIEFLASTCRHTAAAELRREARPFLEDAEISAWQRLHYLVSAARSLKQASAHGAPEANDDEAALHLHVASEIAAQFDARNGNRLVSERLGLLTS